MKLSSWIGLVSMSGLLVNGDSLAKKGENRARRRGREACTGDGMASASAPGSRRVEIPPSGESAGETGAKAADIFRSCGGRLGFCCAIRRGENCGRIFRTDGRARSWIFGGAMSASVRGRLPGDRSTTLRRMLYSFAGIALSVSAAAAADGFGDTGAETPALIGSDACAAAEPGFGLDGCGHLESIAVSAQEGMIRNPGYFDAFFVDPVDFYSGARMERQSWDDARDRTDAPVHTRRLSVNLLNAPQAVPNRAEPVPPLEDAPAELAKIEGDPAYGAYLSNECMTCHRMDGTDEGIPSIRRMSAEKIEAELRAYKEKRRPNPVMQMIAGRLTDEEIASLVAYFRQHQEQDDQPSGTRTAGKAGEESKSP